MKLKNIRFFSVRNLSKQTVPERKQNKSDNIINWGVAARASDNDFPQQLIQDVYNSPVGSSALEVWKEFVQGDGFVDDINQNIINQEGETLKELLDKVSYDVSYMEGFAIHVSYNSDGSKRWFNHVPFEQTRLGLIKKGKVTSIKTNPYYGIPQDYDQKYTKTFYPFNDNPEHVKKEFREHELNEKLDYPYPGQIFWVSIEKPLARVYPQPFYYSGINWFRIDNEIQKFHERNINNNFLLGSIVNIIGDPDECAGETDENGDCKKTVGDQVTEQIKAWGTGSDVGGTQWVNFGKNQEEFASVEAFPTNANDTLFTALQTLTTSQISISTKVPPILIGIQQQGKLGETKEVLNAIKLMQATVKPKQSFISKNFRKIFRNKIESTFKIQDIQLVNLLPEWAFDVLTLEESRKYLDENFAIDINLDNPINIKPQNKTKNVVLYDDYPQNAVNSARKAKDFLEKNPTRNCERVNVDIMETIANNLPLTLEQVERMAKFAKFFQDKDTDYNTDCGALQWDSYGGSRGIFWAMEIIEKL